MNILIGDVWKSGFLDQALMDRTVRIQSIAWFNICRINDLYFIPKKSWRLVFNYIREIGIKAVLQKIISRLDESRRNEKYLSVGIGIVLESKSAHFKMNDSVIFYAPCHPKCMERVVISENLVNICEDQSMHEYLQSTEISFSDINLNMNIFDIFSYRGWSDYSGIHLSENIKNQFLSVSDAIKQQLKFNKVLKLSCSTTPISERCLHSVFANKKKLTGELFGYGQYAKTIILPSVRDLVDLSYIHEIDPTQIPIHKNKKITYDASPNMREDNHYDLCFIAGYHHTHAQLAINALEHGKAAIVEKPIVTTWADLKLLTATMKHSNAPLFSCFHKRYLAFNKFIYMDLEVSYQDPINFYCIVYEVPLPKLHWYTWPNSGSRLLSNGCHWIDYFLFLNAFSPAINYSVQIAKNGDISVFIELQNNAIFTMTLTEIGSSRLGVREHIELRTGKNTVILTDGRHYTAENHFKINRKIKLKKMFVYQNMYKNIVHRILNKMPGDSVESVERSSSLILSLEDLYHANLKSEC